MLFGARRMWLQDVRSPVGSDTLASAGRRCTWQAAVAVSSRSQRSQSAVSGELQHVGGVGTHASVRCAGPAHRDITGRLSLALRPLGTPVRHMHLSALPVAPGGPLQVFGVRLLGLTAASGRKLLLSLAVLVGLAVVSVVLRLVVRLATHGDRANAGRFWAQQAIRIVAAGVALLALLSIWFEDAGHLASVLGLVSAGLAVALQRFVTSIAAYFTILRGRIFRVGDRIVMGGVRGDVVELGFVRTTVMEMGQPPPAQSDDPAVWVEARQHTGRLVTITNDKIFDTPVYNYTRDFPYLWEELHVPIPYHADYTRAEQILLQAAKHHAVDAESVPEEARRQLQRHYFVALDDLEPRVFWQLTDNWLELAVRFVVPQRGVRGIKDAMSRMILSELDAAGISIASGTYEIVGMPRVQVELDRGEGAERTRTGGNQAG